MPSKEGSARSRRRERSSSESKGGKRKRDSDKKDTREKEREKDRKSKKDKKDPRDDRRDEKKAGRSGDRDRDRDRRQDDRRSTRGDGDRDRDRRREPAVVDVEESPKKKAQKESTPEPDAGKKSWRDEIVDAADESSDNEEAIARKREEAKKRREALKAKYSQPGEGPPGVEASAAKAVQAPAAESAAINGHAETSKAVAEAAAAAKEQAAKKKAEEEEKAAAASMFDDSAEAAEQLKKGEVVKAAAISFTGASNEDWDDEEGYYVPKIGEVMDERYLITDLPSGKGVFGNVVKAKDKEAPAGQDEIVAIKCMRRNDMMTQAAEKEVQILEKLNRSDKKNKKAVVRLLNTFAYRRHFCMVFECMEDDLRGALKKHTKNRGMTLNAVRAYTSQLLVGLQHMRDNAIIHADVKPDNILIHRNLQTVKFCDLGTALEPKDMNPSAYLASRFYRPPEVILGCEYSYPIDMWALGCTLFEIFTGKTLFNSKSNNDHLKKIMDLRGKIPGKVVRKGNTWKKHFTDELDFKHEVEDPQSSLLVTKIVSDFSNKTNILKEMILERVGKDKQQSQEKEDQLYVKRAIQFSDLLEQMLALDPDKRLRPEDGLAHPFLQDSFSKAAQAQAAERARR